VGRSTTGKLHTDLDSEEINHMKILHTDLDSEEINHMNILPQI
jgi:hypothetical protein